MITPTDTTPIYTIGAVARLLGVTVMTLHLYERRGLILVPKLKNGHRAYSQSDIERLKCIRNAITEQKISIEGIRTIQSMIPCYETIQCPMEERLRCPAYTHPQAGCWTIAHQDNVCAHLECRTCPVYEHSANCHSIRSVIRKSLQTGINGTHSTSKKSKTRKVQ